MKPNFWFGLLAVAIVVAQIVTGKVAWLTFPGGPIRRDKSPRIFWAAIAVMAAGAAYLIYVGLVP